MSAAADLRNSALDLFGVGEDYGRKITLRKLTPASYDPATGIGSTTTADYAGRGRVGTYQDRMIDGRIVLVGDRRVTWIPDNVAVMPEVGDRMVTFSDAAGLVEQDVYHVINHQQRELDNVQIVYSIQVRK